MQEKGDIEGKERTNNERKCPLQEDLDLMVAGPIKAPNYLPKPVNQILTGLKLRVPNENLDFLISQPKHML